MDKNSKTQEETPEPTQLDDSSKTADFNRYEGYKDEEKIVEEEVGVFEHTNTTAQETNKEEKS